MFSLKFLPILVVLLIVAYLASLSFLTRHHRIKAEGERILAACPASPNCVSSAASDNSQQVAPFELLDGNPEQSWARLIDAVKAAGGEILIDDGRYCHAVFTSNMFRFKDDVELQLQETRIAIRSASRAGHSDLGANRKRVEKIRALYQ